MALTTGQGFTRDGLIISPDLEKSISDWCDSTESSKWQPTGLNRADAWYCRIYYLAFKCGVVTRGEPMNMKAVMDFFMQTDPEALMKWNIKRQADDHCWAGLRILRMVAIVISSVFNRNVPLSKRQKESIAELMQPGIDNKPNPLLAEMNLLIKSFNPHNMEFKTIYMQKREPDPCCIALPKILINPDGLLDQWLIQPWGETRGEMDMTKIRIAPKKALMDDKTRDAMIKKNEEELRKLDSTEDKQRLTDYAADRERLKRLQGGSKSAPAPPVESDSAKPADVPAESKPAPKRRSKREEASEAESDD